VLRIEDVANHPDFRPLGTVPGVEVDLRYASEDNFAGRVLYTCDGVLWDCAWLRREAADGLAAAAAWLERHRPGWRIRVLDALRPQRVQEAIWRDVVGTPLQPYFANPEVGSIHSFGMAVDVTLVQPNGAEADMGSGFDEMSERSHPEFHERLLAEGVLAPAQIDERRWLADAMAAGGFAGIATEWWHFDHGDRVRVRRDWPRVI